MEWIIILGLFGAVLYFSYRSNKKQEREAAQMRNNLEIGDEVTTAGGIIGKVTKISDKGEIKTVILETGSKTQKSYMEFDMSMIYCVMKSTKAEETVETPAQEVKEEAPVEEKAEEPKKAPAKKTAAKKSTSTKKSTTAKKTTKKS